MKKIPTLFVRDSENRSRVLPDVTPGCEWVLAGEGIATRKLDGTCCRVDESGLWWKRRTVKNGQAEPATFQHCETDPVTGKSFGWVPVEVHDKYHIEAIHRPGWRAKRTLGELKPGTYELIGPKIQGNPENRDSHELVRHDAALELDGVPRDYEGLRAWMAGRDIEGVVFHHPDGRMAKIKLSDFGFKRRGH